MHINNTQQTLKNIFQPLWDADAISNESSKPLDVKHVTIGDWVLAFL